MMRKEVIDKVGDFDQENFPIGYGEEVDYCIRVNNIGYTCNVLDNTYIYHAKTKSFTNKLRTKLCADGAKALLKKHGKIYSDLRENMNNTLEMDKVRERTLKSIKEMQEKIKFLSRKRIAFILPADSGLSGGVNSICQEAKAMHDLGLTVFILNNLKFKESFQKNHPGIAHITMWFNSSPEEFVFNFDIIVCSLFSTVEVAKKMREINTDLKIGYYVQDYEPYFFTDDLTNYQKAFASYELIPDALLFAKTDWIVNTVKSFHPCVNIKRVKPSLKWNYYNPYLLKNINIPYPIHIACMLRPHTPRRSPEKTSEVMHKLKNKYNDKIVIHTFGNTKKQLSKFSYLFDENMNNHCLLKPEEVANLLHSCNIFVDMSTYQAFGRTGLEAMSLGCTAIMPIKGGTNEFAINNENCILVDTQNVETAVNEISKLIEHPEKLKNLCMKGLETAKRYNVFDAAYSEIEVIYNWLKNKN